jgi:hypothetical protein
MQERCDAGSVRHLLKRYRRHRLNRNPVPAGRQHSPFPFLRKQQGHSGVRQSQNCLGWSRSLVYLSERQGAQFLLDLPPIIGPQ